MGHTPATLRATCSGRGRFSCEGLGRPARASGGCLHPHLMSGIIASPALASHKLRPPEIGQESEKRDAN